MLTAKKILIVDDHALFRSGLRLVLETAFEGIAVLEASDVESALACIDQEILNGNSLDLVLLDLSMPGMEKLEGLKTIHAKIPETPTALLSAYPDVKYIRQSIQCGAKGYLLKSFTESSLKLALSLILSGETFVPSVVYKDPPQNSIRPFKNAPRSDSNSKILDLLTRRQLDVLQLIVEGQSNKNIARSLGLMESTVKSHVKVLFEKLDADNRTQVALRASSLFATGDVETGNPANDAELLPS
jgi:DNA-binding NarL/FixJ family response regulator